MTLPGKQRKYLSGQRQLILNAFRQHDYGTYVDYEEFLMSFEAGKIKRIEVGEYE
ncbi:hypothetical protein LSUCC1028_09980 [Rhodobacterales bacterium LSUCC1028]|nr:hypothetical protein [Rhodobacterales bacterium LSUCC1028]